MNMNSTRQTFTAIEKTILAVALALSVAAIIVSALAKKPRGGRWAEAVETSVSIPGDTVGRLLGKALITGEDYIVELNKICDNQVGSPGADDLHRNSYDLQKKFADDIFLSLDGVVRDTFAFGVKELFDKIGRAHV